MPDMTEMGMQPEQEGLVEEQEAPPGGLTREQRETYKDLMQSEIRESEHTMSQVRDWLLEHYKAYRLSADLDEIPYDEKVRLPLSRAATTDRIARFAGPFVTQENPITVRSLEGTPPEAAEAQEGLLNRQWHDPRYLDARKTILRLLKIVDWAGVGWVFVDWVQEQKAFTKEDAEQGMTYDETLDLDGPKWRVIHPYDAWPDTRASNSIEGRYFYVREELAYEEFKNRVEDGFYTGEAADEIAKNGQTLSLGIHGSSEEDRFNLPIAASLSAPGTVEISDSKYKPVMVWHRFDSESWITSDPMGEILRTAPNPSPDGRIPIRELCVDPDIQGCIGIPPAEGSHGMNRNANRLASAVMEHLGRTVNTTLGIRPDAVDLMGAADVVGCPFEMLVLPDEAAIFPVRKNDGALPEGLKGIEFFKYFSDIGGNTSDFRKGLSSAGTPGTATGSTMFQQQGDMKFGLAFALVSDFIRDLVSLTGKYNQHFLETSQWIYRAGKTGAQAQTYKVYRHHIEGDFEYNTTASAARTDPVQHLQGVLALVNVFGGTPFMDLGYAARYCAELAGVKNPELLVPGYIPPPMELEQEIELVRLGLEAPVNPGDDHMAHIDAYAAAAMAAQERAAAGDPKAEGEAQRFMQHYQSHVAFIQSLLEARGGGQDVGNASGEKASDKGRPVRGSGPEGGAGMGGGSPGPAGPGRDMGGA